MIISNNYLMEVHQVLHAWFIFQTFSIIDFILPTIKTITKNVYARSVSERVLLNPGDSTNLFVIFTKNGVKNLPPGR